MKKTITINLAGVVFHIEEDAFQILQNYLDSIRNYFSKFKGGSEIQGDIEARIAEIFQNAISETKQAITQSDVENLIRQMGQVEEMTSEMELEEETVENNQTENRQQHKHTGSKRLVRDSSNAIIGGVCAGLASYFEVNPLWIRLVVVGFAFGIFVLPSFFWTIFLGYLILWISMPAMPNLEHSGQYKKFFRSRKDKVVSGLAAGLGKYTSIDPVIFRVLFVVTTFFGGFGLITYLIMWAITPEAKSITDELQMDGSPVTLNNIEEKIKNNIHIQDPETRNTITKIASFPFRLMELLVQGLGHIFRIALDISRVFLGMLLLFLGGVFIFAISIIVLVATGLITDQAAWNINTGDFPVDLITNEISTWMVGFAGLTTLIPALFILLVAISLLANRNILKPVVLMALFSLFLIGLIGSFATILPLASRFSTQSHVENKQVYTLPNKLISLNLNEIQEQRWEQFHVNLELHGTNDKEVKLVEKFYSNGKNHKEANELAKQIQYNVVQQDSSLIFDSQFTLEQGVPFRLQKVDLGLYIPYGQTFKMDSGLEKIITNFYPSGDYEDDSIEGNIWMFNQDGLKCLTCTPKISTPNNDENDDF